MTDKTVQRINDMLDASYEAMSYLEGVDLGSFAEDKRTFRACERCLEIVGEAAASIDNDFIAKHPLIPWSKAKGMRNLLIHEYRHVQFSVVHYTVTESLPDLVRSLESLLQEIAQ